MPKISLIVAISKNHAIGRDNKLLWFIPEDMKRFKAITSGHPVIMGRKTFESIGKPLPNRTNVVVSRDVLYKPEGCIAAHSVEEAIEIAKQSLLSSSPPPGEDVLKGQERSKTDPDEIFVIGGGQIYEHAFRYADKLYVTVVDAEVEGADAFFPKYPHFNKVLLEEHHEHDGLKFTFYELEKE